MTYAIEHYQQALVDNQITSKWCTWKPLNKELAEESYAISCSLAFSGVPPDPLTNSTDS